MKRLKIIAPVALLLGLLILYLTSSHKNNPNAPRYVPAQTQPTGPFGSEYYEWDTDIPFRNGKTWIYTVISRTNAHVYSYDLDNRRVLGELLKGYPVLENTNQDKILCDCGPSLTASAVEKLLVILNKMSFGRIKTSRNLSYGYWLLDLKSNTARKAGQISEAPTVTEAWHASPGFRFGFHIPNKPADRNHKFILYDFDNNSLHTITFSGTPEGWWNDHTILAHSPDNDFLLFDVLSGKVSPFITWDALLPQLEKIGVTGVRIKTLFNWNGNDYDVFFTGARDDTSYEDESFLFKIERPNAGLKLVAGTFKFEPQGHFNSTGTLYIYFVGGGWDGDHKGIHLREVAGNSDRIVVPYSRRLMLPAFYGQSIIYHSNGVLWHMDLSGSNNTRLFTPAAPK